MPLKIQNSNAFNGFLPLLGAFVLCSHGPRAACSPARHGPGDTPAVVPITDTHHKRHLPAQYGRRSEPERVRSSRRRVHVGRRPCVVVGGLPLTNTHNALPRWCLCDRHHPRCVCEGAGRPWTWLCGRRGCCRGATTDGSAHTRGRQDQPNDKDQWARVSADTVLTTGCNPWVLAIAPRPSSRQSTDTGGFGPMGSCRSSRASRRLHSSN